MAEIKSNHPMSGGFYEKFCVDHSGRGTGKFTMTLFGPCEILKPDPADEVKTPEEIVQKMIDILHKSIERDKEKKY